MGDPITVPKIIIGLVIAAIGIIIVIKSEWFMRNFGEIEFAEKHLGTAGGTRFFYKLIGIFIAAMGFMLATGLMYGFLGWILGPLIKTTQMGA